MKPGIKIESDVPGHGAVAERGKTVVVRYDGFLHRGDAFQTNEVAEFVLGKRQVIAGTYATQAMIKFDRDCARCDLLQILCDPENHVRIRKYAGDALKEIGDPGMVPTVLDAVRSRRLGVARASAVLFPLAVPASQIGPWLQDHDEAIARVGFALGMRRDRIERQVAGLMHDALSAHRIELAPSERARAVTRIAEAMSQ